MLYCQTTKQLIWCGYQPANEICTHDVLTETRERKRQTWTNGLRNLTRSYFYILHKFDVRYGAI